MASAADLRREAAAAGVPLQTVAASDMTAACLVAELATAVAGARSWQEAARQRLDCAVVIAAACRRAAGGGPAHPDAPPLASAPLSDREAEVLERHTSHPAAAEVFARAAADLTAGGAGFAPAAAAADAGAVALADA